jgi:hypothetical protein
MSQCLECRPSGVAEASPTLVSIIGNPSCYLCCYLGRVLLSVVCPNGTSYQRTNRPDDRREHSRLDRARR